MSEYSGLETVKDGLRVYKQICSEKEEIILIRLKSKIRTLLGITKATQGSRFNKKIKALSRENWKVGWARLYDYKLTESNFEQWLITIGIDLFVISANDLEKEDAYKLLTGLYFNTISNYVQGLISSYYDDRTAVIQKSRDIADNTLLKVIGNLQKYSPYKAGFVTWMFNIARNTALTPGKKASEKTDYTLDRENEEDEVDSDKTDYLKEDKPGPDIVYANEELGRTILEILFDDSGYPWQILCVGFMKLDYKPGDIVDEFAGKTLREFFSTFKKEFYSSSHREKEELDKLFKSIDQQLEKPLDEIIPARDSRTKKKLNNHLDKLCGDLTLEAFFGKNPNKNISDWNARSLSRLRKELKKRELI